MRKLIPLIMALLLLTPTSALAAGSQVGAGLTPESPLYIFDRLAERVRLALTFDAGSRSQALSEMSMERLAEAESVDSTDTAAELVSDYLDEQTEAAESATDDFDTLAGVTETQAKALERIAALLQESTGTIQPRMSNSMKQAARLLKKQTDRLAHYADDDSPKAAEKKARIISTTTRRLSRLAERLSRFANAELSVTAKKTAAAVAEHVRSVTAKHLDVLQRVLSKAPEAAREAIEKAMERSTRGGLTAADSVLRRGPKESTEAVEAEDGGTPVSGTRSGKGKNRTMRGPKSR